jgi:3-dehydroquinate synthetase
MLTFTLNAFSFVTAHDLESLAQLGRLKHVQIIDICMGTYRFQDIYDLKRYLPLQKLPALREVVASLVLATVANKDAERVRVEGLLRTLLHDKKVEVGCVDRFAE